MPAPLLRVAALLFGSGLCALIYQVAWLRELRLVFGGSTAASAAVLAVFMGGLGAGGLVLGKRAARSARPLGLYGRLELAIAAGAALTPLLVALSRKLYVALGGTPALGLTGGTAVRLLLAVVVLAVPTFLMGGTLPAAAQAVETEGDTGRRRLALLYGANTLGAVTGVWLSNFLLIERLGTRGTLFAACLLNALVAGAALVLSARGQPQAAPPKPGTPILAAPAATPLHASFALWAAAVVGFAFLLMELVWYRMLAPILGGSTFTFGLILAAALLGIGLGGLFYALVGRRSEPTLIGFALTCALEALFMAAPFAAGDRLALLAGELRIVAATSFPAHVLAWAQICALVVLPASFAAGVQFPLLIALLGRGREDVGRHAGLAYAWNTAGAILGSLAGGFGLLPLLSAPGAWRAAVAALALLGLLAVVLARGVTLQARVLPLAATAAALVLLAAPGPGAPWRHGGIGVGRGPETPGAETEDWLRRQRRGLLWDVDGVESSVGVVGYAGLAFVVNGKVDGNARDDATLMVMNGLLGSLVHPRDVESALVVGLGTGATAGWLGALPSIRNVEVVEMEPAVLRMARDCAPVNREVMTNPKVHTFIGDGREVVLTSPTRYDLVISEPSNPYRAGIASLFTQEFYRASVERLTDDGLFVQWLQVYDVDDETVRTVYATLSSVFPHIESWMADSSDLILIASRKPIALEAAHLKERLAAEPYKSALALAWRVDDLEGLLARRLGSDKTALAMAALAEGRLNTDDRTRIEFGFARAVSASSTFDPESIRTLAGKLGEDRPQVGTDVRWDLMPERIRAFYTLDGSPMGEPAQGTPAVRANRMRALDWWLEGDFESALALFQDLPSPPTDLVQAEALGESLAEAGDDAALEQIARLRPVVPGEADAFLGRLRLRQDRLAEATDALEASFLRSRTDPWPMPALVSRALELAVEVAEADAELGARLYRALEKPFAVQVADEDRLVARVSIAEAVDAAKYCREALAPLEPWVPWNAGLLAARARCYETEPGDRGQLALKDLSRLGDAELAQQR